MIEKSSGARGAAQFSNEVIQETGLEQWQTACAPVGAGVLDVR
jgi:hypothetical protein